MATTRDRRTTNLVSFLVTCFVLFVAVQVSDGSFATRINKISEHLDKALSEVMSDKTPVFTDITSNATYVSRTTFKPKGMAGLYNLTMAFMDAILTKDIYPEGFLKVVNNRPVLGSFEEEWKGLLGKYAGILAMIVILGIVIVLMPFCGMCFCCCRCCGKCGARSQPFDKKHDLCKKIVLATLLICLGTVLLFGVVCAFVSNEQMQEGVDQLTDNLRNGVKDINTYLDTTQKQVDTLLNVNYEEFEFVLLETMNESNDIVYNELANYSNAISMTELANTVEKLPAIKNGFDTLKYSTNSLRVYASQLNDAVRKVRKDLLQTLQECTIAKCHEINKNISSLQTNIHFNSLPDITEQISILDNLDEKEFEDAVKRGKQNLDSVRTQIGTTVNNTLKLAREKIDEAARQIKLGSQNVTDVVVDLRGRIDRTTKPALRKADAYIKSYAIYRYYVGLALSCMLLLISLCVALGLICGICGKRPDVYGDDCCNKGAGSQFLVCGVLLMFLSGFVFAVVVLVSFVVGLTTQRIICDPLRDPANSTVFQLIDQVNLTEFYIDFNISQAMIKCYNNESIYSVLHLKNKFNMDDVEHYLDKYNITSTLDGMANSINFDTTDFQILSDGDKSLLENLAKSGFADINFDQFKDLLEENFTTVNLTELSTELGKLIYEIGESQPEIITELQLSKMNIDTYQEKIVEPMIKNATAVVMLAKILEDDLRLGHGKFEDAIKALLDEVENAEQALINGGELALRGIAANFSGGVVDQIQTYLNRVVNVTKNEVGQCGPLSLVINSTLTSTCDKILLPWNGFWFGLFWSLLLFIPTIFVSVKLATLYQKFSPYSGPMVEAEYLYDAYADRDNIPLNSSRSSKNKKNKKKYKRYEDRPVPSAAGDMVTREYAGASHPPDARYADMAPKHWEEFPAGGPPQYQRAPTEYDRPPPYYYPGAAGENQ